ncbi:MAG: hypothetical protein IJB93_01195, partial [Clostridia bacterium]|nr:hypothetical protein [Clostridia bacterium]
LDIIQSPASSFGSYGDMNRGARVITLDENDLSAYETDVIFMKDVFDMDDPAVYYRYVMNSEGGNMNIPETLKAAFRFAGAKIKAVF